MAVVRLLRYWLPSPTEMTAGVLTAMEAEIQAVLTAMSPQQRKEAQITFTPLVQPRDHGGGWILIAIIARN